jgi:ATP-dependent exoDNAse (exonuclease V) beta subunit
VELLGGVSTEVGRIGYVAATRARDILWVAVPANALKELRPVLEAKGFQEVAGVDAVKSTSAGNLHTAQPTIKVR